MAAQHNANGTWWGRYRHRSKRTVDGLSVEGEGSVFRDRERSGFGIRVHCASTLPHAAELESTGGVSMN